MTAGKPVRQRKPRTVYGIDSETINDEKGRASLTLIACSDGTHLAAAPGQRITSEDALSYIIARDGELWTFYGDYDVNFWLRDWSKRALDRLRRTGWTWYGDWRVHHIPRRIFEIWHRPSKRYVCIYDAFPFVQSSFVKWLEEWRLAPADVLRAVSRMKERRASFAALSPQRILRYTQDEVRCIAVGVERLKERVTGAGYVPPRWLGPGAIAGKALREHRAKDYMPRKEHPRADAAYYGGRIETSAIGTVRGPLWYYDIASAYPAAMARLPCLRHGRWKRVRGFDPSQGETPVLLRARWKPKERGAWPTWGPFPCRPVPHGALRYYAQGSGWYWFDEVKPWLAPRSPFRVDILAAWVWERECDHIAPLSWIGELYEKRREMKRAGDPAEYALKLILNSCYGKFAQRVGRAPYRCVEWAGMITAATRARLARLLVEFPDDVLLVATDGVVTRRPFAVGAPGRLGEWEEAGRFAWADVWQPGFYQLSDGVLRTRGFTRLDFDQKAFRTEWLEKGVLGKVPVHRERVIGYRLATSQDRLQDFCTWRKDEAEVTFWPLPRRDVETLSFPVTRTRAPWSWAKERGKDREVEYAARLQAERQVSDYLEDGEPQGYLRD